MMESAEKWVREADEYRAFLQTLSEEDMYEADCLYQEGVSFEQLQEQFGPGAGNRSQPDNTSN